MRHSRALRPTSKVWNGAEGPVISSNIFLNIAMDYHSYNDCVNTSVGTSFNSFIHSINHKAIGRVKGVEHRLVYNFDKRWPIFKILPLVDWSFIVYTTLSQKSTFQAKRLKGVSALCDRLRSCSFIRSTRSRPLEYLENRLTLNHQILHGHPWRESSQTHRIRRYYLVPVGSYSEKPSKIQTPTASGDISRERFKHVSRNITHLSISASQICRIWRH